ncbi:DUF4349 domain-containing protein [Nocardioides flavescens]|uniref:DUF4349 domain-containing protein n=1 Tax=Nocardioides flavescens TaxID=2691959 RepID=A0A6L7F400_9ACTN|nr:DUF4349 domain-containing protein [Nocardioides flavescens]MXG91965.1 DUF4349 domain-containing protein [Nocardioides flavescens]
MTASRTPSARAAAAAALALLALLALTGCSSGGDDSGGASSDSAASSALEDASGLAADTGGSRAAPARDQATTLAPQVVATGSVTLRSDDVGDAVADVRTLVASYDGTVAQDSARTDDDGEARTATLVLRVPTASFDEAMADLKGVATLVAADSGTEDVTSQVVDTDVRVEAQRRSIERIQVLFDRATTIKDVVGIERELSQRQADLESLEQQQASLADRTALATITVTVDRTDQPGATEDASGFVAGLGAGWDALTAFAAGLATVAGVLLPWAVLLLVLALVLRPLVRRARRRAVAGAGAGAGAQPNG